MYGNSSAIKVKRRVPVKKNSNDRTSVPLDKVAVVTVHKKLAAATSAKNIDELELVQPNSKMQETETEKDEKQEVKEEEEAKKIIQKEEIAQTTVAQHIVPTVHDKSAASEFGKETDEVEPVVKIIQKEKIAQSTVAKRTMAKNPVAKHKAKEEKKVKTTIPKEKIAQATRVKRKEKVKDPFLYTAKLCKTIERNPRAELCARDRQHITVISYIMQKYICIYIYII